MKKAQSVNEIWPIYVIVQKFLSKNPTKTATWKLVADPFLLQELGTTSTGT